MDSKSFIPRDEAFKKFVYYRKEILNAGDNDNFTEAFVELCTKALLGDAIAQDCVAYFFNKGFPGSLNPNYECYLSWQILAGANGNSFALEKLEYFLKPALDEIFNSDDILRQALRNENITKDNAVMVVSNLLCEGIVDELNIDPKKLIDIKAKISLYSPQKMRPYGDALERSVQNVVDFLVS